FALSFILGRTFFARGRGTNPLSAIFGLLGSLLRLLASPAVVAGLLFAFCPVIIAKAFTPSRDFANFVTRVRMMSSSPGTLKYQLTSAFPGVVFLQPIDIQFPPDKSPFIYVLERRGKLWRMGSDGGNRELLLDFSSRVGIPEVENGALGFALHPEFGRDGSPNRSFVYAYYTDATVPNQQTNRLVRFDLSPPTVEARSASETPLIEFKRNPDGFHNAG